MAIGRPRRPGMGWSGGPEIVRPGAERGPDETVGLTAYPSLIRLCGADQFQFRRR